MTDPSQGLLDATAGDPEVTDPAQGGGEDDFELDLEEFEDDDFDFEDDDLDLDLDDFDNDEMDELDEGWIDLEEDF